MTKYINNIPGAESKESLTQLLSTWYECQPAADKALSSGRIPSHSTIFLMLVYHTIMVIIHSPPKLDEMWEDESWLLSSDFLVAAEHAGLCTSYLEVNPTALQFAPYFVKIFVQRVFCMHLMLSNKLSHEQSFQGDLRRKVQLHIHALAVMGKTDKMSAVTAKLLALTADGSLGDLGSSSNRTHDVVDKTFTPEEVTLLADANKEWNSEVGLSARFGTVSFKDSMYIYPLPLLPTGQWILCATARLDPPNHRGRGIRIARQPGPLNFPPWTPKNGHCKYFHGLIHGEKERELSFDFEECGFFF